MCIPPQAVLMIGQTIMSHNAQVKEANAQNQRYRENAANALVARDDANRATNRRLSQEADRANQERFEEDIEALELESRANVAASEANVSGGSVASLLRDIRRGSLINQNTIARNFDHSKQQTKDQLKANEATRKNQVNSVQKGYAPSIGSTLAKVGLQAGASFLDSHDTYSTSSSGVVNKNWTYGQTASRNANKYKRMFGK